MIEAAPASHRTELGECNHTAPPLGHFAGLDIVSAHVVELSILTHSKHGEPGGQHADAASFAQRDGDKTSGHQHARARIKRKGPRVSPMGIGGIDQFPFAGLLVDCKNRHNAVGGPEHRPSINHFHTTAHSALPSSPDAPYSQPATHSP